MIEAKVLAVDNQIISLEIPGELIFRSRYVINGKHDLPQTGSTVLIKFVRHGQPPLVRIHRMGDPPG
ncbi:MAG: hypothetical protein CVT49_12955 [candidate division Zixibacteria bacterium HGW-Zixibacteria-1]|nr:MAG: hypothetical protein CVT49_12955 [candidate division Zixibacteria bacterium HGW-Zixibacteria-1]